MAIIHQRKAFTNHKEMTTEQRSGRVDELFRAIANTADLLDYTKNDISKRIEPMVTELWALTQLQESLGELQHKGRGQPTAQIREE